MNQKMAEKEREKLGLLDSLEPLDFRIQTGWNSIDYTVVV